MSYVDELLDAYQGFVALPWDRDLAPPQRVWMAVYPPEHERRLRLHIGSFEEATAKENHPWTLIDMTTSFEEWLGAHEYRDSYFESPELLEPALPAFFAALVGQVRAQLEERSHADGVVSILGAGSLFGLGDAVKVSALLNSVNESVAGRLLVFFPGEAENNSFRLLDARDGWNYMATVIKPNRSNR